MASNFRCVGGSGDVMRSGTTGGGPSDEHYFPNLRPVESRFGVLIETSGGNGEHDSEKLYAFLEKFGESLEGTVASGGQQQKQFWEMRERLAEALLHDGYCYKYDVSVPDIADIYKIVEECKRRLSDVPGMGSAFFWSKKLGQERLLSNLPRPKVSCASSEGVVRVFSFLASILCSLIYQKPVVYGPYPCLPRVGVDLTTR